MTLPQGSISGIESVEPKIENAELDAAIKRSEAQIAAEQTAPLKRKRGRPKKVKPEAAAHSTQSAPGAPSVEAAPQVDLKPIMAQVIKLPFDIAASRTHCPLVKLTEEEVDQPADLANQLFNAYAPELATQDPKRVLLFSFAFTFAMLGLAKAQVYAAWKSQTIEQTVTETKTNGETTQTTVRTESTPPPSQNLAPQGTAEPVDPFRRAAAMTM